MRVAVAVAHISPVSSAVAACSTSSTSSSYSAPESSAEAAQKTRDLNAEALRTYVEGERITLPQVMALTPGLYSDVRVEGSIEDSKGDRGIPSGTYSVAWFYYTYANPVDWSTAAAALDGQRLAIDELCDSEVFPAMRASGILARSASSTPTMTEEVSSGRCGLTCSDY